MADGPGSRGDPSRPRDRASSSSSCPHRSPTAPIELTRVGKWIERVETLRLDGERPTSKALAARLGVVLAAVADGPLRRRVGGLGAAARGRDRPRPSSAIGGRTPAATGSRSCGRSTASGSGGRRPTATEEYEDALLDAFAAGVPEAERAGLPDPDVVLPFANLRRATGERKATGLTGALIAEPVEPPGAADPGRRRPGRRRRGCPRRAAAATTARRQPRGVASGGAATIGRGADAGTGWRPKPRPRRDRASRT